MKRPGWTALALALLLHGVAVCAARAAEGPEDCEPLTAASLVEVGARLDLDADQIAWLIDRHRAGRLRSPEDLDGLPGLGPELREDLEGAWCWTGAWESRLDLAARARDDGSQREARVVVERSRVRAELRTRQRSGESVITRGSVAVARGRWHLLAGHLRRRSGLGMLLTTPGAETRGSAPVREGAAGWRGSLSVDPETLRGVAVGRDGGTWRTEAALLWGAPQRAGERWTTVGLTRRWGATRVGFTWAGGAAGGAWSLLAAGDADPGAWTLEWAQTGSGTAQGAAWRVSEGPWRLRASLRRTGAAFRVPAVRLYEDPPEEDTGELRLEARWQGGSGRHLRLALAEERGPEVYDRPWTRRTSERSLEFAERIHRRIRVTALWRSRYRRSDGSVAVGDGRERLTRADILYRRSPWGLDLRVEERSEAGGVARFTAVRLDRSGSLSWRAAAGQAAFDGDAPDLWWYRRRAGGLYGWDRLVEGAWVGVWARLSRGRWAGEVSAVNRRTGWSGALALRMDLGGPVKLDPSP